MKALVLIALLNVAASLLVAAVGPGDGPFARNEPPAVSDGGAS